MASSFLRMVSGDIESQASTPQRVNQSATDIGAKLVPATSPKTAAARQASRGSSKKRVRANTNKRSQGKRKQKNR